MTKAGFVSLIGAPNAGKSTLMNTMIGQKVSIVTPKVQTTRSCIRGIAMEKQSQVIFVDTPGIFQPKRRLDRAMVSAAWQGAGDSDVIMLVHDVARAQIDADTMRIVDSIKEKQVKAALILNKIDLTSPEHVIKRTSALSELYDFKKISDQDSKNYIEEIIKSEGYKYEPKAISIIAKKAFGSLRDSLTILDRVINYTNGNITLEMTSQILNVLDTDTYLKEMCDEII